MARGAFWTIIVDDQPTAFRAPMREDLLPTLKQLQRQHPTALIKWFQRGRLWETPGDAMDAGKPPSRGVGWRPGGAHKDPRDQYKVPRDVKRSRWASQAAEGRGPWMKGDKPFNAEGRSTSSTGTGHRKPETGGRPPRGDRPPGGGAGWKPKGDGPFAARREKPAWKPRDERAPSAEGRSTSSTGTGHQGPATGGRPPRADRPSGDRPFPARGEKPAWKPRDESAPKPRDEGRPTAGGRPAWKPKGDAPTGDRPAWKPKGDAPFAARGEKPAWKPKGDRPAAPRGEKPAWKPKSDRPTGERPAWKPKGDGHSRRAARSTRGS